MTCSAGEISAFNGQLSNFEFAKVSKEECQTCCESYNDRDDERVFFINDCQISCDIEAPLNCLNTQSERFLFSCLVADDFLTFGESLFNESTRLMTCTNGTVFESIIEELEEDDVIINQVEEADDFIVLIISLISGFVLIGLIVGLVVLRNRKQENNGKSKGRGGNPFNGLTGFLTKGDGLDLREIDPMTNQEVRARRGRNPDINVPPSGLLPPANSTKKGWLPFASINTRAHTIESPRELMPSNQTFNTTSTGNLEIEKYI